MLRSNCVTSTGLSEMGYGRALLDNTPAPEAMTRILLTFLLRLLLM
jgi:hypothetical protein